MTRITKKKSTKKKNKKSIKRNFARTFDGIYITDLVNRSKRVLILFSPSNLHKKYSNNRVKIAREVFSVH